MKKFNSIELGIPADMTYKGRTIKSLTDKTGALKSRDKKKAVKLIPDNDNRVEIKDAGTVKDGKLEFGTAEVEVPEAVVKRGRKVATLTPKTKAITSRKGLKSIRLRGTKENKVSILSKGQEVAVVAQILKKLDEAPIPKKDISALKAKFQMAFKKEGFRKAVLRMREVAKKYKDKEDEKKAKAEAEVKAKAEAEKKRKQELQDEYERTYYDKKTKKSKASKKVEDTTEYPDKWEWLKAQDNWRKILNSIGVKKISLSSSRDEVVDSLKKRAPNLPVPWKEEDKEKVVLFNEVEKLVKKLKEFIGEQADRNFNKEKPEARQELIKKVGDVKLSRNSSMDELKEGKTNIIKAIEFYENLTKEYERQMKEKRANAPPMEAPKLEFRTFTSTGQEIKPKNDEAPAPVKKAKFSYDRAFFADIDKIMSGQTRGVDTKLYNELVRLQEAGDFYQTPESCLFPVLNDIKESGLLERFSESFLEPAFGFGKFTRMLIDNLPPNTSINTIDGLEYLRDTYDMIKDKIEISDLYKGDFMEFKATKSYDLLFMNPPFEGVIEDAKGDRKREKQFWAFMVAKALMLPKDSERISYFLLPVGIPDNIRKDRTKTGKGGISIDSYHLFSTVGEATRNRIAKALKVDDFDEIQQKIAQLSYISSCDSFMKFGRGGKMSKLGLDTAIYKVISYR